MDKVLWLNSNKDIHESHQMRFRKEGIRLVPCADPKEFSRNLDEYVQAVILDVANMAEYDQCSEMANKRSLKIYRYSADQQALDKHKTDAYLMNWQTRELISDIKQYISKQDPDLDHVRALYPEAFSFLDSRSETALSAAFYSELQLSVSGKIYSQPAGNELRRVMEQMVHHLNVCGVLPEQLFRTGQKQPFVWDEVLDYLSGKCIAVGPAKDQLIIDRKGPCLEQRPSLPLQTYFEICKNFLNPASHFQEVAAKSPLYDYQYRTVTHMLLELLAWAGQFTDAGPCLRCASFQLNELKAELHLEGDTYVSGSCLGDFKEGKDPLKYNPNQYKIVLNHDEETAAKYPFRLTIKRS